MKYRTIKISPSLDNSRWEITYYLDPQDREEVETVPHPNGHYHSPESESIPVAINKLIDIMIDAHQKRIDDLEKSRDMLFTLKDSIS